LQAETRRTRSHQPYRIRLDRLVDGVTKRLTKGWTPQEISGRLGLEFGGKFDGNPRMRVSTEVIYAWIYNPAQLHRQLWQYMPRGAKKRRRRQGRRVHSDRIKWRTTIHERPVEVSDRSPESSKTGLRLSKADQARRIQAISNFLSEITE